MMTPQTTMKTGWCIYATGADYGVARATDPYTEPVYWTEPVPAGAVRIGGLWTSEAEVRRELAALQRTAGRTYYRSGDPETDDEA